MKKRKWNGWKRALSMIISLAMIVTACNVYPVHAASDAYSMGFEDDIGTFKSFRDASVQLSNSSSVAQEENKVEKEEDTSKEDSSKEALLTKKVTMKMEKDGYTNAFVQLKDLLTKTSKDYISSYDSIQVVFSVDKVEALSDKTPSAKLFYQPNTTWAWCATDEVKLTAGKDYTITLPLSSINWGSGDTDTGAFGIQIVNFKEGMDVTVSVKSIEMLGKVKSLAANVKTGEATFKYVKDYDCTTADIDLTSFLPVTSKYDIKQATTIEAVINVSKPDNFKADKVATAKLFFMPNSTWAWVQSKDIPIKDGQDIKISLPVADIKWSDSDNAVGSCGIQLNNFKDGGTYSYTVKSFKLVTETEEPEDTKPVEKIDTAKDLGTAKTGDGYLYVSGRKNVISGAYADLTDSLEVGNTYKITAWVKNVDAATDFIKLSWATNEVGNGTTIAAVKAVKGEWAELEAVLSVPMSAKKVILNFTSKNTNNDFGIDDVTVSQIAQGTTSKVKNYKVTDKDIVNGCVTLENITYNDLTIDGSVGAATVIMNNVTVAGKLTIFSGSATKIELNNTEVNQFNTEKGSAVSTKITSLAVTENVPTIVLGPGSSLVRFLAGDDVELTQDEKSVLENIVVTPGANNGIVITLKNVKCNVIVESNKTSPINIVLENAQLNDVTVSSPIAGGQVEFNGDTNSNIAALNMNDSNGVTATIKAPVQKLSVGADNSTINIDAKVDEVAITGNKGNINLEQNATVGTMKADGDNAQIISKGKITSLLINGDNAKATVTSETKVEIKKGTEGSDVKGSDIVVDNNPKPIVITPTPEVKATLNKVLATNVTKKLVAVKDPKYDDACILVPLTDYFTGYTNKAKLDEYERIEIKLKVDKVTNYSATNTGKVTLYSMNQKWNWAEYAQPVLEENKEITILVKTSDIKFDGELSLNVIGLKFSQYAPDTAINCTISSIKLIANDTAKDDKLPDKATADLVVSSTAHTGSSVIEASGTWSGASMIDLTSYLTDDSKSKATIGLYEYVEVKMTLTKGTAFTGQTQKAKLFVQDSVDWEWADGGDADVVDNGTTTVRFPVSKIKWGKDGTASALGKAGIQLYGYAVGQTVNYSIDSIKLIAPTQSTDPEITGDYVEIKKTEWNVSGTIDLQSNSKLKRMMTNLYTKIVVVLDINTILLKGSTLGTAKIFAQDSVDWKWASGPEVAVKANSTITLELPTSSIIWGNDGNSSELGAFGIQFMGPDAGTKIGYKIVSAELTGLKETPPTPPTPATPSALTVISAVTGSALMPNWISDFTAKSVNTKDALSKYQSIEVKLTIDNFNANGDWPGLQIYTNTNAANTWATAGATGAVSGSALTLTMPISSIKWGAETTLGQVGIQFYTVADASYTIDSVKLIAPVAVPEDLTVVSAVTGSALMANYISDFTAKSVITKEALSQYKTIEVKVTVDSLTPNGTPGVQIYTNTVKGDWASKGDVTAVTGSALTMVMSVSDINWEKDTTLGMVGIQFYNATDAIYKIDYIKLKK